MKEEGAICLYHGESYKDLAQWSEEDVIKSLPLFWKVSGSIPRAPLGFLHPLRCVQLSEGGIPGGLPPWLVVPVIRSCQSPIRIWLVNYLHLHLQLQPWKGNLPFKRTTKAKTALCHWDFTHKRFACALGNLGHVAIPSACLHSRG